jgi:hypothetical protein
MKLTYGNRSDPVNFLSQIYVGEMPSFSVKERPLYLIASFCETARGAMQKIQNTHRIRDKTTESKGK